jgi:hypothetical protein
MAAAPGASRGRGRRRTETPAGELPSAKAIAERFARRERRRRLVKQTGHIEGWT